ncbi:hypothetical protein HDU76_001759 [Blyttiomyces sp. JEL0837]|nr:hypothetical protein HDU76_001759 [Blyttiomyces sp. JEL0837]
MSAPFIDQQVLADMIKDPKLKPGVDYQVVDVRDSDFIGGNIKDAVNIPSYEIVENPESYIPKLQQPKKLIFHCALSQVRGPKSANAYLRARLAKEMEEVESGAVKENDKKDRQEVWVLRGGFNQWQARYKDDKDLTENYDASKWLYD